MKNNLRGKLWIWKGNDNALWKTVIKVFKKDYRSLYLHVPLNPTGRSLKFPCVLCDLMGTGEIIGVTGLLLCEPELNPADLLNVQPLSC